MNDHEKCVKTSTYELKWSHSRKFSQDWIINFSSMLVPGKSIREKKVILN